MMKKHRKMMKNQMIQKIVQMERRKKNYKMSRNKFKI